MDQALQPAIWKLTLCYDGSSFAGWQVQPGHRTIQGELATAIYKVMGERVLPQGSGRTDAGVHALGQVASVQLSGPIPAENLLRALNNSLPPAIRLLAAERVPPDFHARHSAVRKTYEYRIWRGKLCLPWLAPYVCRFTFPVDVRAMREAAEAVVGTHDFSSFQAPEPDLSARKPAVRKATRPERRPMHAIRPVSRSTMRTIYRSAWEEPETDLLVYHVCGSGFLHHMVRNLVGTFLAVGRGQIRPDAMAAILAARSRTAAGPTAPASGLWLHSVEYPSVLAAGLAAERPVADQAHEASLPHLSHSTSEPR